MDWHLGSITLWFNKVLHHTRCIHQSLTHWPRGNLEISHVIFNLILVFGPILLKQQYLAGLTEAIIKHSCKLISQLQLSFVPRLCTHQMWPSDVIWWHRSGSALAKLMACCLTAPSHIKSTTTFRRGQWVEYLEIVLYNYLVRRVLVLQYGDYILIIRIFKTKWN